MGYSPQEVSLVVGSDARALHAENERRAEAKMGRTPFRLPETDKGPQAEEAVALPLVKRADRWQIRLDAMDLESPLSEEHAPRLL
jgi:hypothetical protein